MPFENVSWQRRIENFFQGRHQIFVTFFQAQFFLAELIISNLSKKRTRGVRGHAPRKNFWKFVCCDGHFNAFWTIFRQSLFIFLASVFECFTKYDVFRWHSFDYACLKQLRHMVMNRFEIMKKIFSCKALLKMAGGGDASPTSPPPGSVASNFATW